MVSIIVGLGNPGDEYRRTRHNAGFRVVRMLAQELGVRMRSSGGDYLIGKGNISGRDVLLVLPLTYMNRSGLAIAHLLQERGESPDVLLVVCDDVNMPLGSLRVRRKGGDGGNRGLESIIQALGTEEFARLRLGVGKPEENPDLADFVLREFAADEVSVAEVMETEAREVARAVVVDGLDTAMNTHNKTVGSEESTAA
ncbi:aminoacyl-tRNA hydrolase [bacterium]|nr:aminoacyl-tRNA hydrolase [bacterium]